MWFGSNKRGKRARWSISGATALEFAIVGVVFFTIFFAVFDWGRYLFTLSSVRTLAGQLARATIVNCGNSSTQCTLPTANISAAEATVPLLISGDITLNPAPYQSAPNSTTGIYTVYVSVSYPFTFILPVLSAMNGPITSSIQISY